MTGFRRASVALLCAVLLAPAPAQAAATNTLTVTASRTGYAWLVVKRTATYDYRAAKVEYTGHYGGYALGDDTATLWSTHDSRVPSLDGQSWTRGRLRPGRYKLRLFVDNDADGTVKVTIPWTGPRLQLVADDGPVDAKVYSGSANVVSGAGYASFRGLAFKQDARAGANTDIMVRYHAVVGLSWRITACLTPDPATCDGEIDALSRSGTGIGLNDVGLQFGKYRRPWPTRGLYVRGEMTGGNNAGVLRVLALRYYR